MDRAQKEAEVEELRRKFQGAKAAILAEYRGLTVARSDKLRRALEKEGAAYRVVKNTLARIAVKGTDFAVLAEDGRMASVVGFVDAAPVPMSS